MVKRTRVLLTPLLLVATLSLADDNGLRLRPGMTGVPDLGAISCETFTHMHPAGPTGMEQAVLTWAQGYFFGLSGRTIDEILAAQPADADWNFDTLSGYIVAYCAARPEAGIPEAVADLWAELEPAGSGGG